MDSEEDQEMLGLLMVLVLFSGPGVIGWQLAVALKEDSAALAAKHRELSAAASSKKALEAHREALVAKRAAALAGVTATSVSGVTGATKGAGQAWQTKQSGGSTTAIDREKLDRILAEDPTDKAVTAWGKGEGDQARALNAKGKRAGWMELKLLRGLAQGSGAKGRPPSDDGNGDDVNYDEEGEDPRSVRAAAREAERSSLARKLSLKDFKEKQAAFAMGVGAAVSDWGEALGEEAKDEDSDSGSLDLDLGALAEGLFTDLAFDRGDRVQSKLNKDVKGVVERWNDETTLVVKLDSGRRLLMKAAGVSKVRALASALERNAAQVARARSGVSGATGATL